MARPCPVVLVEVLGSGSSRSCQVAEPAPANTGGGPKLGHERPRRHPVNLARIAGKNMFSREGALDAA